MIEFFASEMEIVHVYTRQDRYANYIKENDYESIYRISKSNAKKAREWYLQNNQTTTCHQDFISKYCKIVVNDRNDVLAYSDISFPSNVINIYSRRIEEVVKSLDDKTIQIDKLNDLFLMHEFYHYLENGIIKDLQVFKIKTLGFGKFKKMSLLECISEISATLFMRYCINDIDSYLKLAQ